MKHKIDLVWTILIISLVLLLLLVVYVLDINYIKQEEGQIEVLGEKTLILKNNKNKVLLPHLNVKGTIKTIRDNDIEIELSEYAKTYLETDLITIKNDKLNLNENQRVFIKFGDIHIDGKELTYSDVDIYKYVESIEITSNKKDFYICKNDYGGFMKISGVSFKYNNNVYFKSDYDLSENNEVYFVNVKNGNLLIEEIKSLVFPFKIYNRINPQETRFNELVKIYTNKRVPNEE